MAQTIRIVRRNGQIVSQQRSIDQYHRDCNNNRPSDRGQKYLLRGWVLILLGILTTAFGVYRWVILNNRLVKDKKESAIYYQNIITAERNLKAVKILQQMNPSKKNTDVEERVVETARNLYQTNQILINNGKKKINVSMCISVLGLILFITGCYNAQKAMFYKPSNNY